MLEFDHRPILIPPALVWRRVSRAMAGLVVAFTAVAAAAQEPAAPSMETELRYVDGLNALGLPEYAEIIMARLGSGPEIKTRRLESALRRGQFDVVQAAIQAEPDQNAPTTWAMRLTLADGHFAWGQYPEARTIYDAFFARYPSGPPAEIADFFYESAYKYAQMLILMKAPEEAAKAYRLGLTGTPPREIKRQFQGDLADLLMKQAVAAEGAVQARLLKEVEDLAKELLWIQDLWFGRAIVLMAHVAMLRGETDAAMTLVDDYRDALTQIDEILQEQSGPDGELMRLSPMAQARYLLGTILLDEARRALAAGDLRRAEELLAGKEISAGPGRPPRKLPGALAHFLNVFVRYPSTKWAAEAGTKAEEARQLLERDLKKQVRVNIDAAQWLKVEEEQLKSARAAFNQQQYADAAEQYLAIVNRFPASIHTVGALADLATCYIELEDDLHADTVIAYLSERYNRNRQFGTTAGNHVLGFAAAYAERGQPERREAVYEIYFTHFTQHPLAARLLYGFGERRLSEDQVEAALAYYERVVRDHARSPVSFLALSKMATCYERMGDSTNQIRSLTAYIQRAEQVNRLNHEFIRVLYRLGAAYRALGTEHYPAAIRRFQDLETRLTTARETYQGNAAEAQRNQTFLESAMFYRALCLSRLPVPEDQTPESYQQAALKGFLDLVRAYPASRLAPAALSQAGTLWTVLGNAAEAEKAFSMLKTNYSDSPEARNVDFLLGKSLLELGKRPEAVVVFKRMFSGGGQYSDLQILTAGNELFDAGEFEIAIEAFDQLLASARPDERAKIEPALAGKGRAEIAMARYAAGVETLERLFKQFPRSAFTVEGQYALSRGYAEIAAQEPDSNRRIEIFNQAINAIKAVTRHDTSVERRGDTNLEVGRINELKAQAELTVGDPARMPEYRDAAIATYQTMILFEDAKVAAIRPYLEEAYYRCLRLFLESERWEDLAADGEAYLKEFPNGKYVLEIRQWRNRANARLAGGGG